jgi:hypothetical protein
MRSDSITFVQPICPLELAWLRVSRGSPTSCQNNLPLYLPNHSTIWDSETSFVTHLALRTHISSQK